MNAIEILESMLGGGGGKGKSGGDILAEILGGARSAPSPGGGPRGQSSEGSVDVKELEDMLGVGRSSGSRPPASPPTSPRETPRSAPSQPTSSFPTDIFGQRRHEPKISLSVPKAAPPSQQDQAVLLIRAMINAAKVDGQITEEEQQFILKQVGNTSSDTIQFLRTEFARPINVQEFVNSIPLGLEQQIYTISLMAVQLDTKEEADYLRLLAQGLRISPDTINQLHQKQNVPMIYH